MSASQVRALLERYGLAAHKVIAVDAGHVCQNLYLACEAIQAGTCAIGAYDQVKADVLIQVDGKDGVREDLPGRPDHGLEEPLVGIPPCAAGDLDDEGGAPGGVGRVIVRFRLAQVAAEEPHRLLEIIDVVCPDGVVPVSVLKQVGGGDDHRFSLLWP